MGCAPVRVAGSTALAILGIVVGLTGCTPTPSSTPTPSTPGSTVSAPPSAPSAPSSSSSPSSTPSPSVENSYTPPAKTPGKPDASTAGVLSAKSFPNPVLGFSGVVVEPDEGEYNPNGTWVHAIDGTQAAFESIPQCAPVALADLPKPTAALSGTYRDPSDHPGNALGLQFADEAGATAFFDLYARQLRACPASGQALLLVTDLAQTATTITGRRTYSAQEKWSEMIKRSGPVVIMVIVADQHRASPATLADTAAAI